jgi:hypothetical protein
MPSLSERLKATIEECDTFSYAAVPVAAVEQMLAVCAAVEAFQAAEQAYDDAVNDFSPQGMIGRTNALREWEAAKARLLEVNLG